MGQAIGDILPLAVGVALSPFPIVAVILMLFSPRARSLGPSFVLGWFLGIVAVGGIVLLLADPADLAGEDAGPSTTASIIKLALGVLLLLVGIRQWRGRPPEGETPELPKWMQAVDSFTPIKAFGLAAVLSGVNPKNLVMDITAATTIAQYDLPTDEAFIVLIIFALLASLSVIVPVVWYLVARESAAKTLTHWRVWLVQNNATIMSVVILVIGAILIGKGLGGLTD